MEQLFKRELRSPREIRKMRAAGLIVWQAHQAAARIAKPGVTTAELNQVYRDTFAGYGATPLFLNYGEPPFPAETCISVNDEIVHGIPGPRELEEGDVVSLDTGCRLSGWCGDAAVTLPIGDISAEKKKLLKITSQSLNVAFDAMQPGVMWSEVARQIQAFVEKAGFSVVEELVGHGIGKNLHEPPQAPNYFSQAMIEEDADFDLKPGVVLAIEPMVNVGVKEIVYLEDEWTVVTEDGKPSAHFEHTIAIAKDGPKRLTGPPSDEELELLPEWLHNKSEWVIW
ncbi:MAG: type I methionyl aminopeptidase [Planctomycetota bacterium]